MIRITGVRAPLEYDAEFVRRSAARALKLDVRDILSWRLSRRSVDARDKRDIHFSLNIDVAVRGDEERIAARSAQASVVGAEYMLDMPAAAFERRPVIAGLGPAGLFAGLTLVLACARSLVL